MAGVFSRVDGKSFDVIVIGSGFGGAVAVTELAKTKNPRARAKAAERVVRLRKLCKERISYVVGIPIVRCVLKSQEECLLGSKRTWIWRLFL